MEGRARRDRGFGTGTASVPLHAWGRRIKPPKKSLPVRAGF